MQSEEDFIAEYSYEKQDEFLNELGSMCLHGSLPENTQKKVMTCAFSMWSRCEKARALIEENINAIQLARSHMIKGSVGEVEAGAQIEWFGKLLEALD